MDSQRLAGSMQTKVAITSPWVDDESSRFIETKDRAVYRLLRCEV